MVPTIGGLFLFLDQWRAGSPDSLLLPIYCVLIMVWTALFLDLWRRRNSSIAFRWGVDGVEDRELMRIAALKVRWIVLLLGSRARIWYSQYHAFEEMVGAHAAVYETPRTPDCSHVLVGVPELSNR